MINQQTTLIRLNQPPVRNPRAKKRKKTKSTGHRKSNPKVQKDDDDDDCVVLDGDPYKTTEQATTIDTCAADELLVLGQKGEIACRDFPHPRHACAKYPFDATPHDKYCDMCHCYVCDIRAPCPYWRIFFSSVDHCHAANNKEQRWKNHRESIRNGEMLPLPASSIPQLQSIRSPQNTWSSPVTHTGIRACSVRTNANIRPIYSTTEQSRTFPQNPGLQPRGANGNLNPRFVSSNPFPSTARRPSGGVYTPPRASQANPQRIVSGYISTLPESITKVFARQFNRNMYSGNVQANGVPSATTNLPANQQQQQQQSGRSNNKALSEFEEWLMEDFTPTGPVCPLPGQDSDATFAFDFEAFLK
uniref:RPM1 interacting protein 13 n=1 Tax=Noccaea caerulescens TaxID=107243 RepID=A0A1J3F3K3_NOCCA